MAKNITINFKTIYDDKGIKSATMSLSDLEKVVKNVQSSVDKAGANMAASWSVMAEGFGRVNDMIQQLAASYANAELNATRLEVIMRQRMKSTDAEISSIKKLTSAQAELGIISAGVQRAGAQQLATFLYQKSSLEVLIPAMNNLVAQQRGFNAEAGDAVNVANLMGKAMMGMTSALRRVGITFNEAQEAAIKNGNEQERAAMLAQIITDNVGEMNKALAQTDAGKQKQLANEMGGAQGEDRVAGVGCSAVPQCRGIDSEYGHGLYECTQCRCSVCRQNKVTIYGAGRSAAQGHAVYGAYEMGGVCTADVRCECTHCGSGDACRGRGHTRYYGRVRGGAGTMGYFRGV